MINTTEHDPLNSMLVNAVSEPRHLKLPGPWVGHIPFAQWLIAIAKPSLVVELGTYTGNSYMTLCQALAENGVASNAFAIDTWEGDEHSGYYNNGIYEELKRAHDPMYGAFSQLLRMTFDQARPLFRSSSIDLLHIDGLHTYEAVAHDFENWKGALSDRAVVLFHDTGVHDRNFGVWQLWAEVSQLYPSFVFSHSNGLGVLLVGQSQPAELLQLANGNHSSSIWHKSRRIFQQLGAKYELMSEVAVLGAALRQNQQDLDHEKAAAQKQHEWIEKLSTDIVDLQKRLEGSTYSSYQNRTEAAQLRQLIGYGLRHTRDLRLNAAELRETLRKEVEQRGLLENQVAEKHLQLQSVQRELDTLRDEVTSARGALNAVHDSTSWRVTAGLRAVGTGLRKTRTASRLLLQGRWNVLSQQLKKTFRKEEIHVDSVAIAAPQIDTNYNAMRSALIGGGALRGTRRVGILATQHTMFVAHGIAQALDSINIAANIATEVPGSFDADLYFVICPQMFATLPPPEKRIAIQMEQSVSSRWFTEEYLAVLKNSLAVFDYSRRNLSFLESQDCGYPIAYHVPIGGLKMYEPDAEETCDDEKTIDVLFYGDDKNPRRQRILKSLSRDFNLHIANDVFGEKLHRLVRSARVVLNIHYYENSLLETTRIYECISLGVPVVSEMAIDQEEHGALEGAVQFAETGNVEAIAAALRRALAEENARPKLMSAISISQNHSYFMFMRALLALNVISFPQFVATDIGNNSLGDRVALSLPETTKRRALFEESVPPQTVVFDGLRALPGWKGCGLSYKYLAMKALSHGIQRLTICEDDVKLGEKSIAILEVAERYLNSHGGEWDVFAGLIADLHADTRVLDVQEFEGITFVTLDKMTSMVYNIYSPKALELLKKWDPIGDNVMIHTIDRYLERSPTLRTVTTLPFAVGHREDADSSLWGISNTAYSTMIERSQQLLADKVWEFKATKALVPDDAEGLSSWEFGRTPLDMRLPNAARE